MKSSLLMSPEAPAAGAVTNTRFRVKLAAHHGMCFGVRDALRAVERAATAGPLTILGQLVHNEVVREELAARGVGETSPGGSAPTRRVAITAHGASDRERLRLRQAGYQVTDTTCPLVHKAHQALADLVAGGYHPVVIGRHGHVEVLGLTGDFPEATVVESPEDLVMVPGLPRLGVIAQTTQPEDRVRMMVEALRALRPESEVVYRDTVCRPTKERQQALRELVAECDTVVVIGGSNSNNTRELAEAVEAAGRRVIRLTRAEDLDAGAFTRARVVGVTAGTSTLPATVEAVVRALERMGGQPANTSERPSVFQKSSES